MTDSKEVSSKEIALTPQIERTVIVPNWNNKLIVKEVVNRIILMLPGARDVPQWLVWGLAEASLQLGLNPLIGEIYPIWNKNKGEGAIYPGIKGYRRKAREQMRREGGDAATFRTEFDELIDDVQRAKYHIPANAVAYVCRLYDTVTTQDWINQLYKLMAPFDQGGLQLTFDQATSMIGDKPCVTGVGYLLKEEIDEINGVIGKAAPRNKMNVTDKAQKRAERSALSKRFSLNLPDTSVEDLSQQELPAYYETVGYAIDDKTIVIPSDKQMTDDVQPSPESARDEPLNIDEKKAVDETLGFSTPEKCATPGCSHIEEEHGLDHRCEVAGCKCKKFNQPLPKTGDELQGTLKKNRTTLGRDDTGLH